MAGLSADPSAESRILSAIRDVPRGSVAGYGQIARRATSRGGDDSLPWHCILRSDGRIAFPPGSRGFREQVQRLRAEGVAVVGGRVRMAPAGDDDLDAALWGPPSR